MRFAPQRRALFRHLNFQKWSEHGVLCTFWLGHVLRATTACNFSSLIWPAGSAPAALASLLFDPPETQIIGKTQRFATLLPFRAPGSSDSFSVCMYVFMHACMYVCMYACMHVCMYACMHVCMYACMHVCMHVCMYACMHACMYACMHVCMYACPHVRMYVCMYVCTHACKYASMYVLMY